MKLDDRNLMLEIVDVLRALGGNNGFANLQPKTKHLLLRYASKLDDFVKRDIKAQKSMSIETFEGETVYGGQEQ